MIAPYLIRRYMIDFNSVSEFSEFVSMSVPNFLQMTIKYWLPPLVADGDGRLITTIAERLPDPQPVSMLMLDQANHILPHAFMLQGIGQTHKTLTFVTNVLKTSVPDPSVLSTAQIVYSCLLPTLTEIVSYLGDNEADIMEAVRR